MDKLAQILPAAQCCEAVSKAAEVVAGSGGIGRIAHCYESNMQAARVNQHMMRYHRLYCRL
jgi:hypothetical protein